MPGVIVNSTAISGPTNPPEDTIGQWFVAGLTERGPVEAPVKLTGMADYLAVFGQRTPYAALYDAVKLFFDEGGEQCLLQRIVGDAATTGSTVLKDESNVDSVRLNALSAGPWSGDVAITIADGFVADTFRLRVFYRGVLVEDYNNIESPSELVQSLTASGYLRGQDLGSATAAPNNNPKNVATETSLSAGTDDRASLVSADYVNALDMFTTEYGNGAVSLPGQTMQAYEGIVEHCKKFDRIAILATPRGEEKVSLFGDALVVQSEYAGLFAPWVRVSDGGNSYRTISPEGYVAACRARAIKLDGVWRAPAGEIAVARSIVGLDQVFSAQDSNDLDSQNVNVIRAVAGTVRLYGWRSTTKDRNNYRFLAIRDLLNQVTGMAYIVLEKYVYRPIDSKGHLLSDIKEDLSGRVSLIAEAGGLYPLYDNAENQIDPGYRVNTSATVNTPETLADDTVMATLELRPSPTAATVVLNIYKVGLQSSL